jgi:hypothetical protein
MYSGKVPLSFITGHQKNSENATPVLMSIMGKRFICLSEANKSEKANCARIKELSGLEDMAGRKLFGDLINFRVTCNLTLATNHLLEFDSNDHGTWRRNKVIGAKIKFCKKNIDDFNPDSPYEREADPSLARDWGEDPDVQSSYLSIISYYYSSLYKNYDGIVENVPHPHIRKDTEEYRNKQDHINNFISMKIIKSNDADSEITMNMLIDKYSRWYESLNPDDKTFKKGLQQTFENSKLSKIMNPTRIGKIIKGYRILENGEKPEEDEEYFTEIYNVNPKKYRLQSNIIETGEELWARLCNEHDLRKKEKELKRSGNEAKLAELKKQMLENKMLEKNIINLLMILIIVMILIMNRRHLAKYEFPE